MYFNLLNTPIIRYDDVAGTRFTASLPEMYAALMAGTVASFPALRPHQRHAWHAFLVQLGALVLHRSCIEQPPVDAAAWAHALRRLTDRFPQDEPWCLVVDDITRPALLQPPASSAARAADYKRAIETPDKLDMLRTAKNHDLKSSVVANGAVDDWLFALLTVQTMDGFKGAGNYGISRMNGGTSSRPAFSLAPVGGVGVHVRRDMVALADRRADLLGMYPLSDTGHALLWTIPWDGTRGRGARPHQPRPVLHRDMPTVPPPIRPGRSVARHQSHFQAGSHSSQGIEGQNRGPVDTRQPEGREVADPPSRRFHI